MSFDIFEVVASKLFPSLVFKSFDMESYRKIVKNIFSLFLVERLHIIVKCLFVSQKLVVFKVIVNLVLANLIEIVTGIGLSCHLSVFPLTLAAFANTLRS